MLTSKLDFRIFVFNYGNKFSFLIHFSLGLILKCFCITLAHLLEGQWEKVTLAHAGVCVVEEI